MTEEFIRILAACVHRLREVQRQLEGDEPYRLWPETLRAVLLLQRLEGGEATG